MSLVGTTWQVVAIGGLEVAEPAPPTITFTDENRASVWTGCRDETVTYGLDSDGEALTFEAIDPSPIGTCDAASLEASFLAVFATVDEWRIDGGNRIRLLGSSELLLNRVSG